MKRYKRLRRIAGALIILIAALLVTAWLPLRGSLAQLDGTRTVSGIHAGIAIERDALGVVTIRAQNRDDAMFALGFAHAQERFFEMDLMRRMAAGELAELVGGAAIDQDKLHRPFRMRERAQRILAALAPDERATLDAYRDGVNAGLAALSSRPWEYWLLGQKPAPWSDADSILAIDAMFFNLNGADNARETAFMQIKAALGEKAYKFLSASGGPWDAPLTGPPMGYPHLPGADVIDLRKLDPKLLQDPPPRAENTAPAGSNGFAVNGALTATHAALVANDMHLPLRVPNIWFRARIDYPNPRRAGQIVDLIGVTLPGLPALVAGSNRHVAWGFTNSYGDWMDWVRVDLDPEDPTRYRTADGWKALQESTQIIKVHNAPDVKLQVRDTKWGPILGKDADGTPLVLAWTAIEPGGVNMRFARMDTAETVDEAVDIANTAGMPAQNFIVGDRAGNIAWTIAGKIPKRKGACDPLLPCDWSQPRTGWDGWLAPADYPRLSNPPGQRIWTANARTLDWESPDYAKLGDGGYDFGARARQIRDDLVTRSQFTPDDMLAIQLDDRALLMRNWHELLDKVLAKAGDAAPFTEMKKYTNDWDNRADPASVGYRLAHDFRQQVIDTVLDGFAAAVRAKYPDFKLPKLGQAETLVDDVLLRRPPNLLPPGYTNWDDLLQRCAERVGKRLAAMPGGIAKRNWGEVTKTNIRHPLSVALPGLGWLLDMPHRELPGDINMPRVQAASFGASERFAVEPGHEEYGYFHMPGGQSDNPQSPFYGAGDAAWAAGKAMPFLPGPTKYTLELQPRR
ncbi:MAG: penicillin acylase family protein [Xanthomonadaceae bacterium]|nr:penicillin acylase family protein [Xanthomonadaceae bacterium]MDE2258316.1 penicillin acylase family protein [Xanthomonadaceae bacterium]